MAVRIVAALAALLGAATAKTVPATNVTLATRACQGAFASLPFCNTKLPIAARVADLIDRLWANTSWIAPQLTARHGGGGGNPAPTDAVPELGLPEFDWGLNCLHGVQSSGVEDDAGTVYLPTSFPNPVNYGATWNASASASMAAIIATEARALWLAGATEESSWSGRSHMGPLCWSPTINIARDPRWGRNEEAPSEDPLINGDYGAAYSSAIQGGEDPRYVKIAVTVKHWDAYSLEDADGYTRHNFNAVLSNYGLETTYFPAFRAAVVDGGAKGIMCSYNAVNGVPSCANELLNQQLLRGKWGFSGYITSDTGAVEDVFENHHYVANETDAACVSIEAGTTDVCSGYPYADQLFDDKTGAPNCDSGAINASLARTLTLRMQLGLFDPPEATPYWSVPLSTVGTAEAAAENLLHAQSSMVVLKNDAATLPLPKGLRVAVIGPHANATTALVNSGYLGQVCLDDSYNCIVTPAQAIAAQNVGGSTQFVITGITKNDTASWTAALALARQSDVVILALGISEVQEGESNDRTSIDLPAVQHGLAAAVAALGKRTAIFLLNGGVVDVTAERDNANIGAIVEAFYPGTAGATAIATTLFGTNPHCCGKLPVTVYPASYVNEIEMSEMELDAGPGRGYRFYPSTAAQSAPVYPFGWGLPLGANFSLQLASGPANAAFVTETAPSQTVTYTITVTNSGTSAGDEVVQAYWLPTATPSQPKSKLLKQLFAYERVHLEAGASTTVSFTVNSATLRMVDRDSGALVSTPLTAALAFTNGVDSTVTTSVTVQGSEVQVQAFPY